jgi:hypothetical protein
MEHQDATVRVLDLLDVDAKPELLEDPLGDFHSVRKGPRTDHGARRTVDDTKHELTATFVREGHTVPEKLVAIELFLRLLELEALVFG